MCIIPPIVPLIMECTSFLMTDAKSDEDEVLPSLVVEKFGLELPLSIELLLSVVA